MTAADQKLFPGEFFVEFRDSATGKFETLYRDNDDAVMRTRYEYRAGMLKPGQAVRLVSPARVTISEKEVDTAASSATLPA